MPQVLTSIAIAAPVERVWTALVDAERYDEWNPIMRDVRGRFTEGSPIGFRIKVGRLTVPISAKVVRADGTELRWEGGTSRVKGSHYFHLEPLADGRTRLVHGEEFQGAPFVLAWPLLQGDLRTGYGALNAALKRHCER